MADEQEKPVRPRGRELKVYGWLVFALGFVFIIIGLIFIPYVGTCNSSGSGSGAALGCGFCIISLNALGIGVLLLITGLTFIFVGKSQGKKQKNQNP